MVQRKSFGDILMAFFVVCVFGGVFWVTQNYSTGVLIITAIQITTTAEAAHSPENLQPEQRKISHVAVIPQNIIATTTEIEEKSEEKPTDEKIEIKHEAIQIKTPVKATKAIDVMATQTLITPEKITQIRADTDTAYIQALAQNIKEATNEFRKKNGLSPLTSDTTLRQSATEYSGNMLDTGVFAHTDIYGCDVTCRFTQNNYTATAWGENLGEMTFSERPTAEEVANYMMEGWKKSDGHRKNLLSSDFTHQGIGVAMNNKSLYVTVNFSQPVHALQ